MNETLDDIKVGRPKILNEPLHKQLIQITKEQKIWLINNNIKLSSFVRHKIIEEMKK